MTRASRMSKVPLTKLLRKPVGTFKVISVMPDTVTVDENRIQNTKFVDRVTVAPDNANLMTDPSEKITC